MTEKHPGPSLEVEDQIAKMFQMSLSSPDEAPKPIIQEGPLFDPVNYNSLIQIVNELDLSSFVKFARTCKDLHYFCFNAKGIQVQFPCFVIARGRDFHNVSIEKAIEEDGHPMSEYQLEKLQKMPFIIVVKDIKFQWAKVRVLEEVRQMLQRFRRVVVESASPDFGADWSYFIQFLEDYNVKRVNIWGDIEIPVDLLPFFLTKHVTDDLILSATVKYLRLPCVRISHFTFTKLLQKFANENIVHWFIGRNNYCAEYTYLDLFIKACSEVSKSVKMKEIDWNNLESSVLYKNPYDSRDFYLRKSDGAVGKLHIFENWVYFSPRI